MDLKNKKVLVTGAGGFVGSHLAEQLIEHGCSVRCFIRYNSRNDCGLLSDLDDEKKKDIEIVTGDLRDPDAILKSMQGIDAVFHLGALIAIPYSYVHPNEVAETNILGTLNVLIAARDLGIKKLVHTSTSEVYGTAQYVPINETHPLQGQSPYSASKIGADKLVESFYNSYGLPAATIRPFNIYGPRQSARAIIPTIIIQALTQNTISIGNTKPTRNYTYIKDTVEAFIKIAESDKTAGNVFNIGSSSEISVKQLAEKILKLTGKDIAINEDKNRFRPEKSEVERLCADSSLAHETFMWKPKVSIETGLKRTINWISNNLSKYQIGGYVI